jgi:hypothetical protein
MPLFRYLQHWLTGCGPCLPVADVVPDTPPIRQGAATFPWAALVAAVDRACARRFPKPTPRGRPPVSTRVVWAWEVWNHAVACADAQRWSRLRTALAVLSAWGIMAGQVDGSQEHVGLPAGLAHVRSRRDAPLRAARLAIQAATAREEGLVSPAPVVVDTFPSAPGSQRVHDAATLEKAAPKSSRSSRPEPRRAPPRARRGRGTDRHSSTTSSRGGAASVASAGGGGRCG